MISYRYNEEGYDLNNNFEKSNNAVIEAIVFRINQSYYDSYKRVYQRLQSLLAEIMSVVNLLFEIGRQLSNILCNKKMSKDIIEHLLNKNKRKPLKINKINGLIKNNGRKDIISERKEIIETKNIDNIENIENINNIDNINNKEKNKEIKLDKMNEIKRISKTKNIRKIRVNNQIMKQINYCHILKSFLCFKDKKNKLINLCENIINEDMSIERILERFYNFNIIEENRLKEVYKYIYIFINDIKKDNCFIEEGRNNKNFWKKQNVQKENTSVKLNLK